MARILDEMQKVDQSINSAIILERGMGTGHAESSADSNSVLSD